MNEQLEEKVEVGLENLAYVTIDNGKVILSCRVKDIHTRLRIDSVISGEHIDMTGSVVVEPTGVWDVLVELNEDEVNDLASVGVVIEKLKLVLFGALGVKGLANDLTLKQLVKPDLKVGGF